MPVCLYAYFKEKILCITLIYFVGRSQYWLSDLNESLVAFDEAEKLPRVFFCSLTWVTGAAGHAETSGPSSVKDHKFVVIKVLI